jgi:hypothetical protein
MSSIGSQEAITSGVGNLECGDLSPHSFAKWYTITTDIESEVD